ncbi:MAG: hypothetical protein AAB645_01865, partial [Patescibacteria group bacterium]
LVSQDQLSELRTRYEQGGLGYKESKEILIENLIKFISPLRAKRKEIAANSKQVRQVLVNGAGEAKEITKLKMAEVRKKVGVEL